MGPIYKQIKARAQAVFRPRGGDGLAAWLLFAGSTTGLWNYITHILYK